jgi:hypothetical protein
LKRVPTKIRDSRLPNLSKVRQPVTTNDLKTDKNHKVIKSIALSGINMSKRNDKDMSEDSDEERERQKKQHKDLKKPRKSSNSWPVKRGDIDPVAFSHQIELAFAAIKNRQSSKPLNPEEVQNHLNAIGATVSNRGAFRRLKKNSSKVPPPKGPEVQESVAPEGQTPEGTTNHGTGRVLKVRSKRKRSEVKSEPDSESSKNTKETIEKVKNLRNRGINR